jgi:fumarate hydratase subunit beta
MIVKITTPASEKDVSKLRIGDKVLISGEIYTARDAAHKRLLEDIDSGKPVPFDLKGCAIYYVGPSPAKPGQAIGSCGPTTSGRMDPYTGRILQLGAKILIGKGNRSPAVIDALKKYKAVYLGATGGAAALLAKCVRKAEVVAYPDLGAESIQRLTVVDFPATVINDVTGADLYIEGIIRYAAPEYRPARREKAGLRKIRKATPAKEKVRKAKAKKREMPARRRAAKGRR